MKTLIDIFRSSRKGGPDAVALYDGSRAFTYEQLDAWSDAIARALMISGVGRGDRVALRRDPGAEMVAELLGILKSGACYVPVEVRNPAERSGFIARDAGVVGLLGEPWDGIDIPVLHLPIPEHGDPRCDPGAGACEWPAVDSSDLAYVIYTSGTTGTPKGVPITHGSVVSLLEATDPLFRFRTDDVWLLFHSIAFDFSVWEIWGAFAHGAAVVPLSRWDARDPQVWLDTVKTYGVTVLN